jgi:hypothetical protein
LASVAIGILLIVVAVRLARRDRELLTNQSAPRSSPAQIDTRRGQVSRRHAAPLWTVRALTSLIAGRARFLLDSG